MKIDLDLAQKYLKPFLIAGAIAVLLVGLEWIVFSTQVVRWRDFNPDQTFLGAWVVFFIILVLLNLSRRASPESKKQDDD